MPTNTLTLSLSDDQIKALQERAGRLGLAVEDLVRRSIDDLLSHFDDDFERAAAYVLDKNAELYRRLA
jgi:hypothetical protein